MLSAIFWDPSPVAFTLPLFHFDVAWYSIFFATGLFLGYLAVFWTSRRLFSTHTTAEISSCLDKLVVYLFFGILLGARLGHVFFYDWSYFSTYPHKIYELPIRGLSSHGAVLGLLLSLALFWHFHKKNFFCSFRRLLDLIALGASIAASCIRIGNFFNQEILGKATTLPWGILYGHPAEPVQGPSHPVQLYEALFYLALFLLLLVLLNKKRQLPDGRVAGILFVLLFAFRFLVEFLKLPQGDFDHGTFVMGQLLSLPYMFLGFYLVSGAPKICSPKI